MSKIVIIGIDGMDRELISKYLNSLPNFKKIIAESPDIKLTSVFPPDSDTAWASIYTGLNPAKHGVVEFVDPLKRTDLNKSFHIDNSAIKNKTFWDIASKNSKQVCLIYPHLAYPVWSVNGFMINHHPKTAEIQIYPSGFEFNFEVKKLDALKKIPKTKFEFKEYLKKKTEILLNDFSFGKNMLINYHWDLYFFYSSTLDSIKHLFWSYCDPNDPTYPGENIFKNVIKDLYILHDKLIGDILESIESETPVLIFSDHGHSMRPVNLFNINEVLRREGYLFSKEKAMAPIHSLSEKIKRLAVDIVQCFGLRPAAMTIVRLFPKIKEMYAKPSTIDFNKTVAHCTDLSGMKSYSYGGICLNKDRFDNERSYVIARKKIIELLSKWTIPDSDEKVFDWICEKEELYNGEHRNKYPDIIFNLREDYGAGWAIKIPEFSKTTAHKFFPGSHRGSTPVLYAINMGNKKCRKNDISLMDIAPTILNLMDITYDNIEFDGEKIFE